ncbi:MAG: hypothetical protein ACOVO9_07385 [Bacteroidia bacterium]
MKTFLLNTIKLSILLFLTSGCEPIDTLGTINIDRILSTPVKVNSLNSGETFDSSYTLIMSDLKKQVEEKGGSNINIQNIQISKLELFINDTLNINFEDFENVEMFMDTALSLGSLPIDSKGKYINLAIPGANIQNKLKEYYLNSTNIPLRCKGKAKNAIPTGEIFNIFVTFRVLADVKI